MDIFDFIFKNPFLLIILIWVLSGIFKGQRQQENENRGNRQKPQQKQEQQRQRQTLERNPRPVAQPIEMPWERPATQKPSAPISRYEANKAETISSESSEDNTVKAPVVEGDRYRDVTSDRYQGRNMEKTYSTQAKQLLDFKKLNSQSVVQGIVWAQVLGSPRSKEPHRTSRLSPGGYKKI